MIMQHHKPSVQLMTFAIYILLDSFYKLPISISGIQMYSCVYELHEDHKKTLIPLKITNLEFLLGLHYSTYIPKYLACICNPEINCYKLILEAART